jgi:hypothetical protein
MARWKPKKPSASSGSTDPAEPRMNAKLRRHFKEKARREKLLRQRPPGTKERFVSGCLVAFVLGVIAFIAAFTYACVVRE